MAARVEAVSGARPVQRLPCLKVNSPGRIHAGDGGTSLEHGRAAEPVEPEAQDGRGRDSGGDAHARAEITAKLVRRFVPRSTGLATATRTS